MSPPSSLDAANGSRPPDKLITAKISRAGPAPLQTTAMPLARCGARGAPRVAALPPRPNTASRSPTGLSDIGPEFLLLAHHLPNLVRRVAEAAPRMRI
jgi:hypothetical protein